ncbi:methyltransferase family protein [Amycolatopsis echigonensis]|uniref:Methyltransferase family protein n=1 Tax=Amycolatopsis echigonensis TaxID=2576905 RepID=A0A2N3WH01_9PSEU|nr:class I SAM-dependent methyltransferase [Amycolatopsis niigatensis]PKV93142.1 methyltransferase family protein [Amycolatopsis niigatensis]
MSVTPDGCPVDLYLELPAAGEPEVIHGAIPPGAEVLELGCGTGRVTHPLLALGHPVVAVDESAEMLAHVRGAETVCARIDELHLDRRFPVVVLGSHLVNGPDRKELLAAVRRHLTADGQLLVEWHPPAWFDQVADGSGGRLGDVRIALEDVRRDGARLSATVVYSLGGRTWKQPFTCENFSLEPALEQAGLRFERWVTADRDWFSARPSDAG